MIAQQHLQTPGLHDFPCHRYGIIRRLRSAKEGVLVPQLLPFEFTHLVEWKQLDLLDAPVLRKMVRQRVQLLPLERPTGKQHMPQPHGFPDALQIVERCECLCIPPPCETPALLVVDTLDIEQYEIHRIEDSP